MYTETRRAPQETANVPTPWCCLPRFLPLFRLSEESLDNGVALENARWSVDDPEPCVENADCDDGDGCTDDWCVAGSCRHITSFEGCCNEDSDCDDGMDCSIDTCDPSTTTCKHTADLTQDYCCNSATDCYDSDVLTLAKCVNYKCAYDCLDGCYGPPWSWCDDNNLCTTDWCEEPNGCQNQARDCDDGKICTSDSCDVEAGTST